MRDYQGDFKEFKDRLAQAGISKEVFDVELQCAGLTYDEIDGVVTAMIDSLGK
jgi:uncharacterized protein YbcV (DUF1398 family)